MSDVHEAPEPLDGRQLRTFITLAKTGSFTRAGHELSVTQSAVSHAMKSLESDIGCRLFDRLGKKVHLTPAGEHFLHHAERVVAAMLQARTTMEQLQKWGRTQLRVGASHEAIQHLLPAAVLDLRRNFPQVGVVIEHSEDDVVSEMLETKRIDLAFTLRPELKGAAQFDPLFSDELALFVAPDHRWARAGHVTRTELGTEPFIRCAKGSRTDRLIHAYFQHEDITLNAVVEVGTMEAAKPFARLGAGVAILPSWIAAAEVSTQTLVSLPLGKRKLRRYWGILHPTDRPMTLCEDGFVRACQERCVNLGLTTVSD